MSEATARDHQTDRDGASGVSRRQAVQHVAALLGGTMLAGGDGLLAYSFDLAALTQATAQGVGTFSAADVAWLDEVADTILPETTTPGAKAAKTGAFGLTGGGAPGGIPMPGAPGGAPHGAGVGGMPGAGAPHGAGAMPGAGAAGDALTPTSTLHCAGL